MRKSTREAPPKLTPGPTADGPRPATGEVRICKDTIHTQETRSPRDPCSQPEDPSRLERSAVTPREDGPIPSLSFIPFSAYDLLYFRPASVR